MGFVGWLWVYEYLFPRSVISCCETLHVDDFVIFTHRFLLTYVDVFLYPIDCNRYLFDAPHALIVIRLLALSLHHVYFSRVRLVSVLYPSRR